MSPYLAPSSSGLYRPLDARLHYGHPDFIDKLTLLGQGGVSKAVKGLHLSEDVYAGLT